ncbi:hypothetical protein B7463_g9852, partial [Scytalidium lignicola]
MDNSLILRVKADMTVVHNHNTELHHHKAEAMAIINSYSTNTPNGCNSIPPNGPSSGRPGIPSGHSNVYRNSNHHIPSTPPQGMQSFGSNAP